MEDWRATELLPKQVTSLDTISNIKTSTGEELFDNFRLYYGDDPSKYNISFEAILGIYCNRIEWINFFQTAIACGAHAIKFDDLNKMTLGKMLFFIQVPRIATGNGVTAPKQTTILVTKYTEKHPISIPFEISAACLTHLRETFENTILDKILNTEALNTVLRAIKNSADALERGLINTFMNVLINKAPPQFILNTLLEHNFSGRQTISRVQRANVLQSFKSNFLNTLFILNRTNNKVSIQRFLVNMVNSVTESILNNPSTYKSSDENISGVLVTSFNTMQTLTSVLSSLLKKVPVSAPVSYGKFVLGADNAVNAIAHQAIMADFTEYARRAGTAAQEMPSSEVFDNTRNTAQIPLTVARIGEKTVLMEQLEKVYKNTDMKNPLEQEIEITFFFPLGLYLLEDSNYSTVDQQIRMKNEVEVELPTSVFFCNKDNVIEKIEYSDILKTLCHPAVNDTALEYQIFAEAPVPTGEQFEKLCKVEHVRERPGNILKSLFNIYEAQEEMPKSTNMMKSELSCSDFFKPENITMITELHPMFDFTYLQVNRETQPICTPRIMLGNIPQPLAPASFHESRAKQIASINKISGVQFEATIQILKDSLSCDSYPELAYILEMLVHGNKIAFRVLRNVILQCIRYWYSTKSILLFCNSFDMIVLITCEFSDDLLPPTVYNHYRNIVSLVRTVKKMLSVANANEHIGGEPACNYLNGLFDPRLFPPFLHTMPRNDANVILQTDDVPLTANTIKQRNYELSDLGRMNNIDTTEVYADADTPSQENLILRKIYYFCVIPALTNNHLCGAGVDIKNFILDFFYCEPFICPDEVFNQQVVQNDVLLTLIQDATGLTSECSDIAKEISKAICFMTENTKIVQIEGTLDPAQRHGHAMDFHSLHYALYNGLCLINPVRHLKNYFIPIPICSFYANPGICAAMSTSIRAYLNAFPHYHRCDGGFPLPQPLAQEYYNWHRSPFFLYSASCANNFLSVITLAAMHFKLSPISTAIQSRRKIHPGYSVTLVRTDVFETDNILYTSKSSTGIILNNPIVTKEEKDIASVFHVSQNLNFVDMGLGFGSTSCCSSLKRVKTDMGAKCQNLFKTFPLHAYPNRDVNNWIRNTIGVDQKAFSETEALNILTFGNISHEDKSLLLYGQQSTCEAIITPVTANPNNFKHMANPRGRSSCMMGTEPHDEEMALRALYDHSNTDSKELISTFNPWASQRGSLGDVLYNRKHRERLGHNPSIYSPCSQFFTTSDILTYNKFLFSAINEYCSKSKTCIDGDSETQYVCVEGTKNMVRKPCTFFQEAIPLHSASSQALLETRLKNKNVTTSETHFGNLAIGETIPFSSILSS